jgi:hypothetical protein
MNNFRTIWKHEVRQVDRIVKALLENKKVGLNWKIILPPVFLNKVYHYRKDLRFTRKNILYTKQFAFDAAKNILSEIELLIQHYLGLFSSRQSTYPAIIKEKYPSKGNYLAFLSALQKAEEDVIQAAITTMRKGTKKDRRQWFQKVKETTKQVRMAEAQQIYE